MIGKLHCYIVRLFGWSHVWRRLRKGETSYIPASQVPFDPVQHRVCDRCHIVRAVKRRGGKVSAQLDAGLKRLADK